MGKGRRTRKGPPRLFRHDVTEMLRRDEDFDSAILKERAAMLGLA